MLDLVHLELVHQVLNVVDRQRRDITAGQPDQLFGRLAKVVSVL
jgi:hypothetical protein